MPLVVNGRLMSNREQVSKLKLHELRAYEQVLEKFLVSSSPMIAQTLKEVRQEIEWRNAANTHKHK